ncbi:hypothetical protein [Blastopirellula retiformator]|uniref:hypothetical protein n=1 Tax=Blastopirellula retiformator TaxID=2527970 RepID=UPI0011B78101|nr:hypothetical protein [Blastopirellula retiformator]
MDQLIKTKENYKNRSPFWAAEAIVVLEEIAPSLGLSWAIASVEAMLEVIESNRDKYCRELIDDLKKPTVDTKDTLNAKIEQIWHQGGDLEKAITHILAAKWEQKNSDDDRFYRLNLVRAMTLLGDVPECRAISAGPIFELFKEYRGEYGDG